MSITPSFKYLWCAGGICIQGLGTEPLTLPKSMWTLQEPSLWLGRFSMTQTHPNPTNCTPLLCQARSPTLPLNKLCFSLGHSSFCSIFSTVTCCLLRCNTLYSARVSRSFCSALRILPLKQCYKNYAVNSAQRPPPLPSPPCQASSIFSNH